ncbi:MAG: ComF family protein [Arenimonas sp.]
MDIPVNQKLRKKVDDMVKALLWSLLPPHCLLCDQPGMGGMDLCQACWLSLPGNLLACQRCALPLAVAAQACADCIKAEPPFLRSVAPMQYQVPLTTLVPRLKFHQDLAAGRLLAELFCRHTTACDTPDVLVPVPLHSARLRKRGFDQALELAKMIARHKAIPLRTDLLFRTRNTAAQSYLDASHRHNNLKNAFVVKGRSIPAHIALIDDVMTTGTTVRECTKVLLKAGVKRVDIWVIARVATP